MGNQHDLIHRMLNNDPTSFQDILQWYAEDVLRLSFMLLRNSHDAQDILQESMLGLVNQVKQGKFRSANGSIKGFLLVTARNLCLNRLKRKIHFEILNEHEEHIHGSVIPSQVLENKEFEGVIDQALDQLSPLQRIILVLHELQDESTQEIANELNLSVENVRMHLCRARKKMRAYLAPFIGEA